MKNLLENILETITEGVIYQEADGGVERWNQSARKIFGLPGEGAFGQLEAPRDWELIHEDGSPCPPHEHPSQVTLSTGRSLRSQVRGLERPGQPVTWLSINTQPLFRPGRNLPYAVVVSFLDITESKKSDEALRSSEERFRAVSEYSHAGIAILDQTGKLLWVNEEILRLTGYPREAALAAASFVQFLAPESREFVTANFQKFATGQPYEHHYTFSLLRADGRTRLFEKHMTDYTDQLGRRLLILSMLDVTERQRAQAELRASEERYRALFEGINSGVAVYEVKGEGEDFIFRDFNRSGELHDGQDRSELIGKSLLQARPGAEQFGLVEVMRRVWRTGRPERLPVTLYQDALLTGWYENFVYKLPSGEIVAVFDDITEQKRVELELRKSQERLRLSHEAAQAGAWEWDLATGRNVWSEELWPLYGLSPLEREASYEAWRDSIHPDDRARIEAAVQEAARSGGEINLEWKVNLPGPQERWLLSRGRPHFDDQGRLKSYLGIVLDITDRQQAEREREITLQVLRHLSRPNDLDQLVETVTRLMREWSGCEAVGIRLKQGEDFPYFETRGFPPAFVRAETQLCARDAQGEVLRDPHGQALLECMCGNVIRGRFDPSLPFFSSNGSFWTNSTTDLLASTTEADRQSRTRNRCHGEGYESVALIPLTYGEETFGLLQFNDPRRDRFDSRQIALLERLASNLAIGIAQRYALQALGESEARNRQILMSAMDGFWRTDTSGRLLEVNQAYCRLSGYSREELLAMHIWDLEADENPAAALAHMRRLIEAGDDRFESRHRRKDGSYFDVEVSVQYQEIKGAGECVVFVRDITAAKQAAAERRRLEAQLRQGQKMEALGTLAGGIAHDFNNILGAVLGFAEIAHDDAKAGAANPTDIAQIIAAAERAKELVQQILTFSRKNEPALKPLSLTQTCKKAQAILERTLPKMIALDLELDPDLPPVLGDPTQLEQVLLNLASNAADAMPEGGRLRLATRLLRRDQEMGRRHPEARQGEYALLTVSDTGQGMDQATQGQIFDPFFTTKALGRGTGLGLSTVWGIVKSHGGFISCASQPGRGASFEIHLPALAREALPAAPGRLATTPAPEPGGGETILLADDEGDLRAIASRFLQRAGYRVLEAASGEEALAAYSRQSPPPDLVLLDLGMPGMGGLKCLTALVQAEPAVKVLIASGYAADNQVKTALTAGAAGYVAKPFKREELLGTVRAVLDRD
ncbi:MAG: PAS domain S-box protein [Deltaproteobacteria bacterium]|nr:PAS domain S-box protein [Deltaproteobacteria bacterium]